MRKLLAILLGAVMVLSLAVVGVSAAEPEVITTAEQFATMAEGGSYKLGADITLTASVATFNATLDGDGHKIKTTVPIFTEITGGTIKNLVIGDPGDEIVDTEEKHLGALARSTAKNTTAAFENITNNVSVTSAVAGSWRRGGLIGQLFSGHNISFKNIVNNGNVKAGNMIGGIVGYGQEGVLSFTDCINHGKVTIDTAASLTGLAGGIIGREGGDSAFDEAKTLDITNCLNDGDISGTSNVGGIIGLAKGNKVTITNCTNKGAISSTTNDAGGMIGHGGAKGYLSRVFVTKCLNEGKITCTGGTVSTDTGLPTEGTNSASGIAGYIYGSGDNGRIEIVDCVNKGEIVATAFASQFMGYTNNPKTVIKNCVGDGKITGAVKCITGLSSANPLEYTFEGIKLTANDSTDRLSFATAAGNSGNIKNIADYTSQEGKADAITANATYTLDAAIGYQAPAAPSDPGTTNPGTTVVTGDTAVIVMIIAAVSLLGMGIALKARKA